MKKLKVYQITEEQFKNTEYRPDVEIDDSIETEDDWDYADVVDNMGEGLSAEKVVDVADLMVYVVRDDDDEIVDYVVELK